MLSFLGMLAAVLITVVVVGGFVAIAFVFVFEAVAMLTFWIKNSLKENRNGPPALPS